MECVMRVLLWIGTALDVALFAAGLFLAGAMVATVWLSPLPILTKAGLLALAALLPMLCIYGPTLAWRAFRRHRDALAVIAMLVPLIYGVAWATWMYGPQWPIELLTRPLGAV
jgi:hypothetical protein